MVEAKAKDAQDKEARTRTPEEVRVASRTEEDQREAKLRPSPGPGAQPEIVTVQQVDALLKYVIDHRIDVDDSLPRNLHEAANAFRAAASDAERSAERTPMVQAYIALAHAIAADPLPIEQVDALVQYAAERGLNTTDDVVVKLYGALADYKTASDDSARKSTGMELIRYYSTLTKLTYDKDRINGKTLMSTRNSDKEVLIVISIGLAFFILASLNGIIGLWSGATAGDDTASQAVPLYRYALSYLSPFFWGGLGACVFIAKRVADETADLRFDYERFKGVAVRIFLGAVLGGLAASIVDINAFALTGLTLKASAVAFIAGLGYKVVYGSFEKAVEAIAEKLDLASLRRPTPSAPAKPPAK